MVGSAGGMLAGGAILGVIAASFDKVRAFGWRFVSFFLQSSIFHNYASKEIILDYLIANHKVSFYYDKHFTTRVLPLKERGNNLHVILQCFYGTNTLVFWKGWVPIFLFIESSDNDYLDLYDVKLQMITIRGLINVDTVIKDAYKFYDSLYESSKVSLNEGESRFFIQHIPQDTAEKKNKKKKEGGSYLPVWKRPANKMVHFSHEDIGLKVVEGQALDNLVFPDRVKKEINEIKLWANNKAWYEERGIPWKRGWLLFGEPGTGKTALTRAFAEELDIPVFIYHLSELGNFDMIKAWRDMSSQAPCIALIEDIDSVFKGRMNISMPSYMSGGMSFFNVFGDDEIAETKSKLNGDEEDDKSDKERGKSAGDDGFERRSLGGGKLHFDTLINCLDGIEQIDGVFTVITTNRLDYIDEALGKPRDLSDDALGYISTRPGRIDKAIKLTYMTQKCKRELAKRILKGYDVALEEVLSYIEENAEKKETPAQFQEFCAQKALEVFWAEKQKEENEKNAA